MQQLTMAWKSRDGRGRGRRHTPEPVTESATALVSDLKAQLLEDSVDAGTTVTTDDAEKPKRGRGRGRLRKSDGRASDRFSATGND